MGTLIHQRRTAHEVVGFIRVQRRGAATILSALHRTQNCAYLRNRLGLLIASPPELAAHVAKCQLCFDRKTLNKKKVAWQKSA